MPTYNKYSGRSNPPCGRTGEPLSDSPIVDDGDAIYLEALLETIPPIYLDEIKSELEKCLEHLGFDVDNLVFSLETGVRMEVND